MTLSANVSNESTAESGSNQVARLIGAQLELEIGKTRFETWFEGSESIRVSKETVEFLGSTEFALQRVQTSFGKEIRQVVDRVCGPQFAVSFLLQPITIKAQPLAEEPTVLAEKAPGVIGSHWQQRQRGRGIGSFYFGSENRLAKTSTLEVFERLGQMSPFFVHGPTGSGKTHLLEALTNEVRRKRRLKRCVFLSAEQFTNNFLQALRGSGLPMFRRKYRDLDLLAIDDIQFLAGKRATIAEFQFTIDNLSRLGKQVVLSGDRPPVELLELAPDLIARLASGLICPLNYPDFDVRMKIAQRFCQERNFSIPNSLLHLVCDKLPYDVRRLSGAINRLHAANIATGRPVSEDAACRILSDLFAVSGRPLTSLDRIEKAVCEFCHIRPAELRSSSRKQKICTARMLAMYLSREYTSSPYSEIGDYFGGRSHSTVIAARKKFDTWLKGNERIHLPHAAYEAQEIVKRLETQLHVG